MPGHISKESWSRCEQPSMLYDTVRNPSASRQPPRPSAVLSTSKDTIETVQQRLNREMLERLHTKGRVLPHDSFVAVIQVGKYLFLAVMLPPYLCFYALPKWLLQQLLPLMAEAAKQTLVRWGAFMLEFSKQVTDLMKGMIDQTIGWAIRVNKDRFRRAGEAIAKFVGVITQTVQEGVRYVARTVAHFREKVEGFIKAIPAALRAIGEKSYDHFKSAVDYLLAPVAAWSAKVVKAVQASIQTGAKALFGPMGDAYVQASRQVDAFKQFVVETIKRALSPVFEPIADAAASSYRFMEKVIVPVAEKVKESYEKVVEKVAKGRKAVEEVAKAASAYVQSAAAVAYAAVADQVRYAWQVVPMAFGWVGKKTAKLLPKRVHAKLVGKKETFQKWKGVAGRLASGTGRGVKEVVAMAGRGVASGLGVFGRLFKLMRKIVRWVLAQVLVLPMRLLKGLGRAAKVL